MMQSAPSSPRGGSYLGGTHTHTSSTGTYTRQRAAPQQALYSQQQPQQPLPQQAAYPPPGYRLGGSAPYRDDPSSNPHLESFTHGSLGPQFSVPESKGKQLPLSRRLCQSVISCILCRGCSDTNTNAASVDDGTFYQDEFNDMAWSCSVGTTDEDGIWMNRSDPAGTMMSLMVWFLIGYSALTMTFLASTGGIPSIFAFLYCILASMALACHAKTSLTDPGSVPASAVPTERQRMMNDKLSMCSQCQTFKPPLSHHCRICNRCISKMDHHCPWMNNCIGAGNMKHFVLFLIYTWTCSVLCLLLLGWNYFFCANEDCIFTVVLIQLVRVMTVLSVGAFLFTSSMLMNVCFGLISGIGTIDRLKKKATNTMADSDEEQIPLKDVFGIGPYYTWPFPCDPILDNYDRVMGYSTPQRLLREQMKAASSGGTASGADTGSYTDAPSVVSRDSFGIPV